MGVFSRFMDIINSNINALLDKAEDPQKMIKLMINEIEDTIVEIKTSCATVMADRNNSQKKEQDLEAMVQRWQSRAELAIQKGRDDLAREAIVEKHRVQNELETFRAEKSKYDDMIKTYKEDIAKLEEKLAAAKAKLNSMNTNTSEDMEKKFRDLEEMDEVDRELEELKKNIQQNM